MLAIKLQMYHGIYDFLKTFLYGLYAQKFLKANVLNKGRYVQTFFKNLGYLVLYLFDE